MKRLTEVGIRTGTDKANYHQFTEFYDDIFSTYESPRILEIGIASGASLRMYLEYFKNPYIVAADIYIPGPIERCKLVHCDQSQPEQLLNLVRGEEPFDIILDDGGHFMQQQQITLATLFPYVKSGGYFIMEDVHTSFLPNWLSPHDYSHTTYEMLRLIEKGELGFSNFIDTPTQEYILNRIDTIQFWSRIPGDFNDSGTCVMKLK